MPTDEPWIEHIRVRKTAEPASGDGMQVLLVVGAVLLSLGAALGTASIVLSLLLRLMSKMR